MLKSVKAGSPAETFAAEIRRALDAEDIFKRNGLTADLYQKELLNSHDSRIIICAGRQIGKSAAVAGLCAHVALTQPESSVILSAPSERQVAELLRTIKTMIQGAGYRNEIQAETKSQIDFFNGSRILAVPGGAPQNIRGFSAVNLVAVDEAAHLPDDELFSALSPMLAVSNGQMILLSTPHGMGNRFAEIWHGDNGWKKLRIPSSECRRISQEFLEQQRAELGPAIYAAEYECSFLDGDETALLDPVMVERAFQPCGVL